MKDIGCLADSSEVLINVFLVEIPQRDRQTLEPIIQEWILSGKHIVSDGWPPYNNIENIGGGIYTHDVITSFVRRISSTPTMSIFIHKILKACGVVPSALLRHMFGTSRELFEHYRVEFMWRSKFKTNQFGNILCQIAEQYPV